MIEYIHMSVKPPEAENSGGCMPEWGCKSAPFSGIFRASSTDPMTNHVALFYCDAPVLLL